MIAPCRRRRVNWLQRLRQIVADSDPAITAQIMAASDKRLGTVKDVTLNQRDVELRNPEGLYTDQIRNVA